MTGAAAIGASALGATQASGAIIYSGPLNVVVDSNTSPVTLDIGSALFEFVADGTVITVEGVSPGAPAAQIRSTVTETDVLRFDFGGSMPTDALNLPPTGTSQIGPPRATIASTEQAGPFDGSDAGFIGIGLAQGKAQGNEGWLEIEVSPDESSLTILGWAYEDAINTDILAGQIPEPGALMIAAAAVGALVFRRARRCVEG